MVTLDLLYVHLLPAGLLNPLFARLDLVQLILNG